MKSIIVLLLALVLMAGTRVSAAATTPATTGTAGNRIIADTFSGPINGAIKGRTPNQADLPGGRWKTAFVRMMPGSYTRFKPSVMTVAGMPSPLASLQCRGSSSGAITISLASRGSYKKPQRFTISAELGSTLPPTALGFYSKLPTPENGKSVNRYFVGLTSVERYFTGLLLITSRPLDPPQWPADKPLGTLILFQNGYPAMSVPYTGKFDPKKLHRLSYSVNTRTGAITNVHLQGSTSDYSVFRSRAFTNAATAYAGIAVPYFGQAYARNFQVAVNTAQPSAPQTPTLLALPSKASVRLHWNPCDATSYSIYRGTTAGAQTTRVASGITAISYTDRGLTNGVSYFYKVKAVNASGAGISKVVAATPATNAGLRVFTIGNSFAFWNAPWLREVAASAGIHDHIAGVSYIGGSNVIQHWGQRGTHVMSVVAAGRADVLTMDGMYYPGAGIDRFTELAFANNPHIRVMVEEFWLPFDATHWPPKHGHNFNNDTVAYLRSIYTPYFRRFNKFVWALNKKLGKTVVHVIPVGQAVLALRAKIIAGQAPGIKKQSQLFIDPLGHPNAVIQTLSAYCYLAVIYHRNPIGLPVPQQLAKWKSAAKLNRLLQTLAWNAVTSHSLSGVKARTPTARQAK